MKRTGLIAGLIIIALTAGSVLAFGKSYARDIYTFNCEYLEQRPEQLTKFCADAGVLVYDIKWKSWGYNGAEGTGTYSENLCEPNCAEGKRVSAPVNLTLSNLTELKGKHYLRTLDVATSDGKDFPWGRANSFQWDVMEFVEMTPQGKE